VGVAQRNWPLKSVRPSLDGLFLAYTKNPFKTDSEKAWQIKAARYACDHIRKTVTLVTFYTILRPVNRLDMGAMPMKSSHLKLVERTVLRPVAAARKPNAAYRVREHLTEAEMDKLLAALRRNRHGHRDWLVGLMIYRHGLRVSEACDLRWGSRPRRTHRHCTASQGQQ